MQKWKKVSYFAHGVIYADGNKRKLVMPQSPDVYFELDTKKVWWQLNTGNTKPIQSSRGK